MNIYFLATGIVKHDHSDYSYSLEDSTGLMERIWREDIISENDGCNQVLEVNTAILKRIDKNNMSSLDMEKCLLSHFDAHY